MAKNEKKPQDTTTQAEPKTDTKAPVETQAEPKTDTQAKPTTKKTKTSSGLLPVSEWAEKHNTPGPILGAVRRAQAWAWGKQVTEEQFLNAVEAIKTRPMGGGRARS